jgi:uncharacterized protein YjiS (DUF1127 family)
MVTGQPVQRRLGTFDYRRDGDHGAVCRARPASISTVRAFCLPRVSPPPLSLVRSEGPGWRRAMTRQIRLLTAIRRFLARPWQGRRRAGPQMQLCELSNHLLKDIGLRREYLAQGFAEPYHGFD